MARKVFNIINIDPYSIIFDLWISNASKLEQSIATIDSLYFFSK